MKKWYLFLVIALLFVSVSSFAETVTPVTTTAVNTEVTTTSTSNTNTTVISTVPVIQDITASELIKNLPGLKQGMMWNINNGGFNYLMSASLVSYKKFSLEAGYTLDGGFVGIVSYPIANLKDYGVTLPILNLVSFDIGFGVGYNREEVTYGPTLTLIDLKF